MRRRYVASMSLRRHVPTGNLAPLGPPQYSKPWPPQYSKPSYAYVQGSILGSLLFLLYINDIVIDIGSNIRLFADDISLYIIVEDPVVAANCLNSDLNKITQWAATWLVSFNPTKTESIIISRKSNKNRHPSIYMQNHQIFRSRFP